jgi:hypothetical protein
LAPAYDFGYKDELKYFKSYFIVCIGLFYFEIERALSELQKKSTERLDWPGHLTATLKVLIQVQKK